MNPGSLYVERNIRVLTEALALRKWGADVAAMISELSVAV